MSESLLSVLPLAVPEAVELYPLRSAPFAAAYESAHPAIQELLSLTSHIPPTPHPLLHS